VGLGLSACAAVREFPLAPNMVRLDVGPAAGPSVNPATLKHAAEVTLLNGYSAFRLTPIYALAFDQFGVTVVMFHAGEPGAWDAFDAAAILGGRH
jgi:hypothetical protein